VVALESRATGADRGFSPEIQVITDPRFGRGQENFGGDPYLVSEMAVAAVTGLHGPTGGGGPNSYLDQNHILSEAKHFAAYGAGDHDGAGIEVSQQQLHDVYLRPWRAYIGAGGRAAMAAHNSLNGEPCHSSKYLLTHLLRSAGELNCPDCLVGTDFNDINNLQHFNTANVSRYGPGYAEATDASIQAITAGVDQDLGGTAFGSLQKAIEGKLLDQTALDRAAANALRTKFAAGLFDRPMADPALAATVDSAPHRALARRAAVEGAVLLQDPGGFLPFSRHADWTKLAVVGPSAGCDTANGEASPCDASAAMVGGYAAPLAAGQVIDALGAFTKRKGQFKQVNYTKGVEYQGDDTSGVAAAVALAQASDVVVALLGDSSSTCDEAADRMELDIPGQQLVLLAALVQTGKPVVVVLVHGRPMTFGSGHNSKFGDDNALLSKAVAVLSFGRPGEEGGNAMFDVLTGLAQPTGRLNQPWPRSAGYVHSRTVP
jgi:beta-glucosidase